MFPTVVLASFGGAASAPPELEPLLPPLLPPPLTPLLLPLPPPDPLPALPLELPVSPPDPAPAGPPLLEEQAAPEARAGTTRAPRARRSRFMVSACRKRDDDATRNLNVNAREPPRRAGQG
jgi:hypothetical protein